MYARIHEDLINTEEYADSSRKGMTFGDGKVEGLLHIFRCLDDDGIPYYVGVGDDESLEYVFEWTQRDAGVTLLQVMDLKTYTWKDEIG